MSLLPDRFPVRVCGGLPILARSVMNARPGMQHRRATRALTFGELLVLLGVLALLAVLAGPRAFEPVRVRMRTAACARQLKSIGVAFRLYANDQGNLYPNALIQEDSWQTNCNETLAYAWRRLSNELGSPRRLVCPGDTRFAAVNFQSVGPSNVSYFMSLDALPLTPEVLLAGDRNLSSNGVPIGSGLLSVGPQWALGATKALHQGVACLLLVDGSVKRIRANSGPNQGLVVVSNRLAIP